MGAGNDPASETGDNLETPYLTMCALAAKMA